MRSDLAHDGLLYLDAEEIGSHCNRDGTVDHAALLQAWAQSSPARPLGYLSLFELCHRLYFGARDGRMLPAIFAECWNRFVDAHQDVANHHGGHIVWLSHELPAGLQPDPLRYVVGLAPRRPLVAHERASDPREHDDYYTAHCERMRAIARSQCEDAEHELAHLSEAVVAWGGPAPQALPQGPILNESLRKPVSSKDLVLDSNVAIEILNQLTPDGQLPDLPMRGDRILAAAVRQRLQRALETCGLSGRIIVPLTVMEESQHNGTLKASKYPHLLEQLEWMNAKRRDSWLDAFTFEDLSFDVFETLWCLLNDLCGRLSRSPTGQAIGLPTFTDCMVLTHGLVNSCWVASAEWTDKTDWDPVKELYPWLMPSGEDVLASR